MTKRRSRRLPAILGAVVLVLVLAVALLPLLVPRDQLRQLAERQVVAATGGEVSLGPVSLRVLPRLRLVLGESSVRLDAGGLRAAGQDPGPLLRAEAALTRLEVDLALWPLLRRELDFGTVRLIAPRIALVTAAAADSQAAAAADTAASEPAIAPDALDFGLALAAVEVRDGELSWLEEPSGREVLATGWRQDMTAPHLGVFLQRLQRLGGAPLAADAIAEPAALELEAHLDTVQLRGFGATPLPPLTDLSLRAVMTLPPAAERAEFRIQELSLPGWLVTANGHATAEQVAITELSITGGQALALTGSAHLAPPPQQGALGCNLTGTVDLARIVAQFAPWLPPSPPDGPPRPELTGTLQIGVAVDLPAPPPLDDPAAWAAAWRQGLAGRAALTARGGPLTVAAAELGEPVRIGAIVLDGDLRGAQAKTRLQATGLAHPALQGDAVVEIVPAAGKDQAVAARLELPRLDLDALTALVEAMQKTARAPAAAAAKQEARAGLALVGTAWAGPADRPGGSAPAPGELIPPDLAVDLTATVREIMFLKSTYTEARLQGTLRARVIAVDEFSARLGGGRLTGKARLDYAADPRGKASWDVQVQEAPATLVLAPYLPAIAPLWTGLLSAKTVGACDLADPAAMLNSLNLAGDLQGSNGIIDLREPLSGVSQYLGQRQDLMRVQYNEVWQAIAINDGRVMVDGLRIGGRDTDWLGSGWLGLDGTLNLNLNVRLPAGFTPDLGDLTFLADALRDKDGRINLDFSLTGEARRPTVGLNLDPAALLSSSKVQDKLKAEGQEQLQKLQEEVKKGAGGLLDRLRGGR